MLNYYLINPAVAGVEDAFVLNSGYQGQFIDKTIATRDFYFSGYTGIRANHIRRRNGTPPHHAIGGIISSQKQDLVFFNSCYLSYAYHFPVSRRVSVSLGALAGMNQFVNANQKKFDMGVGTWLYSNRVFVGASSLQLLQGKNDNLNSSQNYTVRQYYITGGYKLKFSRSLTFIPSLLLKVINTLSYVDINSRLRFRNLCWFGAGYRTSKAVALFAGFAVPTFKRKYDKVLEVNYCYSTNTSDSRDYFSGKHEIVIGLRIPTKIRCRFGTADYW